MSGVTTYPEMNSKIVGILEMSDNPHEQYAAQRIRELEEELKDYKHRSAMSENSIEQTLGEVLGYPKYRDDPKNFPNVTDNSVCVGEHTAVTLADEASNKIKELEAEVGGLKSVLKKIEWVEYGNKAGIYYCPMCKNQVKHNEDCKLAKALSTSTGEEVLVRLGLIDAIEKQFLEFEHYVKINRIESHCQKSHDAINNLLKALSAYREAEKGAKENA